MALHVQESANLSDQLEYWTTRIGQGVEQLEEQVEQWRSYKRECNALIDQLSTLADETSRPAMIPIGKLAFMPGRLIHTNEILVLLGEQYHVERSTKQAQGIVQRRKQVVEENLSLMEAQLNARKATMTEAVNQGGALSSGVTEEGLPIMDIREPLPEPTESKKIVAPAPIDKEGFPASVQRAREILARPAKETDKALLDMLNELEAEEDDEQNKVAENDKEVHKEEERDESEESDNEEYDEDDEDAISSKLFNYLDDDEEYATDGIVTQEDMTVPTREEEEEEEVVTEQTVPRGKSLFRQAREQTLANDEQTLTKKKQLTSGVMDATTKPVRKVTWGPTADVQEHDTTAQPDQLAASPVYTTPLKEEPTPLSTHIRSPADIFRKMYVPPQSTHNDGYPSLDEEADNKPLDLQALIQSVRSTKEPMWRHHGDAEPMLPIVNPTTTTPPTVASAKPSSTRTMRSTVMERETAPVNVEQVEEEMDMREIAAKYHRQRQGLVAATGGFSFDTKPEIEVFEEELALPSSSSAPPVTTSVSEAALPPKKMSRFKAARLGAKDQ